MDTNNTPLAVTPRTVVAAVIVNDANAPEKILAAARSYPEDLAGQYEFPGGKIEPGETPTAALERELQEELQITVRVGPELLPSQQEGQGAPGFWPILADMRMRVFFAVLDPAGQTPHTTGSHSILKWVTEGESHVLPWLAPDRPIVQAAWHYIKAWAKSPKKFF